MEDTLVGGNWENVLWAAMEMEMVMALVYIVDPSAPSEGDREAVATSAIAAISTENMCSEATDIPTISITTNQTDAASMAVEKDVTDANLNTGDNIETNTTISTSNVSVENLKMKGRYF